MSDLDQDDVKDALKEGLREWLDEKFAAFGKWSLMGLGAAALAGLVYLAMAGAGWHK
jgi:hypothetical protein